MGRLVSTNEIQCLIIAEHQASREERNPNFNVSTSSSRRQRTPTRRFSTSTHLLVAFQLRPHDSAFLHSFTTLLPTYSYSSRSKRPTSFTRIAADARCSLRWPTSRLTPRPHANCLQSRARIRVILLQRLPHARPTTASNWRLGEEQAPGATSTTRCRRMSNRIRRC